MKAKYLHILSHPDVKFNPDLVRMVNESNEFNIDEFLFVTWHENVYEKIKKYNNVLLLKRKKEIFKWMRNSEWVFMHANCLSKIQTIFLPKKICKKIIWRTWGHDIRPLNDEKNILKKIAFKLYIKKVNMFRAIGIANEIDAVNVKNVFGDKLELFPLNYRFKNDQKAKFESIKSDMKLNKNKEIRILLGHNAGVSENHIENLYRLSKYANENIKIIMPISYNKNDMEYVDKIKKVSIELFGKDKIEFIEDFLEYFEYVKLISNIDVAIMDQTFSNGLGNLSFLIFFEKVVYVNRNGNIAQSFESKDINTNYTDTIGKVSFQDFVNVKFDAKMYEYIKYSALVDENASVKCMKRIIDAL